MPKRTLMPVGESTVGASCTDSTDEPSARSQNTQVQQHEYQDTHAQIGIRQVNAIDTTTTGLDEITQKLRQLLADIIELFPNSGDGRLPSSNNDRGGLTDRITDPR